MLKRRDFVAGWVAETAQERGLKFFDPVTLTAFRNLAGSSSLGRRRHLCEEFPRLMAS